MNSPRVKPGSRSVRKRLIQAIPQESKQVKIRKERVSRVACLVFVLALTVSEATAQETVIVRPVEIKDILINPGMGITTFPEIQPAGHLSGIAVV